LSGLIELMPGTMRFISDWYLLLLIPFLYRELGLLNYSIFHGRYFDSIILNWEQRIFGGQPSRSLARTYPSPALSEYLHFSYLSYYLIIYIPAIYLYARGRRDLHQKLVFNLMLTFFAHYLFYMYFPVQGPRYLFPAPGGQLAKGYFYKLAHKILEAGSARGAAFPSSHVGVSFSQAAFTCLYAKPLAPFALLLAASLTIGAVYGGFHYGTDVSCGLIFGLLLFFLAPKVARALQPTI
jgi:membrane-associated phospholipid phosphatase